MKRGPEGHPFRAIRPADTYVLPDDSQHCKYPTWIKTPIHLGCDRNDDLGCSLVTCAHGPSFRPTGRQTVKARRGNGGPSFFRMFRKYRILWSRVFQTPCCGAFLGRPDCSEQSGRFPVFHDVICLPFATHMVAKARARSAANVRNGAKSRRVGGHHSCWIASEGTRAAISEILHRGRPAFASNP